MKKKILVVLSGGQDSTTCLFLAKEFADTYPEPVEVHAITFDYGQRHRIEIEAAIKVAEMAGVASHEIIPVPNCLKSTSPLTSDNQLEQYKDADQMEKVIGDRVELTFVPMRNSLFFIIAANRAVALGCTMIVTGICQADNANYPDCTDDFRYSIEEAINTSLGLDEGDKHYISVTAPLMYLNKAQSVRMAVDTPGCMEALAYSHTSYDGKYPPTDMNHANVLRAKGFEDAGVPDPLVVRAYKEGLMELPFTNNYHSVRMEASKLTAEVVGLKMSDFVDDHVLYTDADEVVPSVITDNNGQVVLALCKKCGKGEAELVEPCAPREGK